MKGFKEIQQTNDNELRDKAILLYGFSDQQVHEIIDLYRTTILPETSFAKITPITGNKRVKEIIQDIIKEKLDSKQ